MTGKPGNPLTFNGHPSKQVNLATKMTPGERFFFSSQVDFLKFLVLPGQWGTRHGVGGSTSPQQGHPQAVTTQVVGLDVIAWPGEHGERGAVKNAADFVGIKPRGLGVRGS